MATKLLRVPTTLYDRRRLPAGETGIYETVRHMRNAVDAEAPRPEVRALLADVAGSCGPTDADCRAQRIFRWVQRRLRYMPDPWGIEALGFPSFHIRAARERGYSVGDCDDAATMLATLAKSAGLRTRFVVASFRPDRRLHHIWTEVFLPSRGWVEFDTFRSERFSGVPTRSEAFEV